VRIESLPDWVRSEEAVKHLHVNHRTEIQRRIPYGFRLDYEAASLGDPDPDYLGDEQRSKQSKAIELFNLANLALWIVRPTPISLPTFFHFDRPGDPSSVRESGSGLGFLQHERDTDNRLSEKDLERAIKLHDVLFDLDRQKAVWIASRLVWKSLFERLWEIRVLIQWVAIEAIFGPPVGGELTYRISHRIGFFLGEDRLDAKRIKDRAKNYYKWRSKIVHGSKFKISREESLEVSYETQEYIRKSLLKILESKDLIDVMNSKNREKYLDDLIFQTQP
jgi:hypothetical protein